MSKPAGALVGAGFVVWSLGLGLLFGIEVPWGAALTVLVVGAVALGLGLARLVETVQHGKVAPPKPVAVDETPRGAAVWPPRHDEA